MRQLPGVLLLLSRGQGSGRDIKLLELLLLLLLLLLGGAEYDVLSV